MGQAMQRSMGVSRPSGPDISKESQNLKGILGGRKKSPENTSQNMGSQHPSPNVKTLCNFEPQIWPEIITSRDAERTCFKGSRTSCDVIIFDLWVVFSGYSLQTAK